MDFIRANRNVELKLTGHRVLCNGSDTATLACNEEAPSRTDSWRSVQQLKISKKHASKCNLTEVQRPKTCVKYAQCYSLFAVLSMRERRRSKIRWLTTFNCLPAEHNSKIKSNLLVTVGIQYKCDKYQR